MLLSRLWFLNEKSRRTAPQNPQLAPNRHRLISRLKEKNNLNLTLSTYQHMYRDFEPHFGPIQLYIEIHIDLAENNSILPFGFEVMI